MILEYAASVGGVWAQERLYPGLRMNNLLGTFEFSDFPMDQEAFGIKPGEHISGEVAHRYLRAFAEHFGISSKIRFRSKVESIEKLDTENNDHWLVTYLKANGAKKVEQGEISTPKIIVATGAHSEPFIPNLEGAEDFDSPIFHSKDLAKKGGAITQAKSVVVLGAAKSGYDAAYLAASQGVEVDWIINESGRGPGWIAPPYVTPFKMWLERLVNTRFFTWFSPCSWGDADGFGGIRNFLHKTAIGRWIVDIYWKLLAYDVVSLNGFDKHPETKKLKPWTSPFWVASSFSILNYPTDLYDLVREGKIRVHVADIHHLSPKTVHLVGGHTIKTDVLISCTGWKSSPNMKFLPEGIDKELGFSHKKSYDSDLVLSADATILTRFPRLHRRPEIKEPYHEDPKPYTPREVHEPFRLYRHMVPPALIKDRSIGFVGLATNFSVCVCSQIQALWLTAYLDGKLPLNTSSPTFEEDVRWSTIFHSQFGKWRYPFGSRHHPDFVFDVVPYLDWLLGDLGLKSHRKMGWWSETFEPYGAEDYRGLIEEFQAMYTKKSEGAFNGLFEDLKG